MLVLNYHSIQRHDVYSFRVITAIFSNSCSSICLSSASSCFRTKSQSKSAVLVIVELKSLHGCRLDWSGRPLMLSPTINDQWWSTCVHASTATGMNMAVIVELSRSSTTTCEPLVDVVSFTVMMGIWFVALIRDVHTLTPQRAEQKG